MSQDSAFPTAWPSSSSARPAGMPHEPGGSERATLANAMVGLKKQYYGRGPTAAKAWLLDDYVFVAMEGGLTRDEETLLADGKEELVRSYRLSFQETTAATTMTDPGDHGRKGAHLPRPESSPPHAGVRDLSARA